MGVVLFILCVISSAAVAAIVSAVLTKRTIEQHHADAIIADEQRYKERWKQNTELLMIEGKLSPEDAKKLMLDRVGKEPAKPAEQGKPQTLPTLSSDRRDLEIARAKQGLPPYDDLKGMFSSDVRRVLEARIQYGTSK